MIVLYAFLGLLATYIAIAAGFCAVLAVLLRDWRVPLNLYLRSTGIFLLGLPVTLAGYPIVALALPFRTQHLETAKPFRQFPGTWMLVSLPAWAKLWDNPEDGALGDTRGWWDNYCQENYNKPCTAFRSMWQWLAVRNSANGWSRVTTGVDASRCAVVKLLGNEAWQFLEATRDDGKKFYLFEGFLKYQGTEHGIEWRIGWKVEINDITPPDDRYRGSVYRIRPWKAA